MKEMENENQGTAMMVSITNEPNFLFQNDNI